MCQEKVEAKKRSFRTVSDGFCVDVNTGQRVVFHGVRKDGRELMEAICISDVLKERAVQGQKVQQFLDAVRSIFKDCKYQYLFPSREQKDQGVRLSCKVLRNNDTIGYVENMDYLLDCDYIYKLIFGLPIEAEPDCGMNIIYYVADMFAYYSELFQLGVLKPYDKNSQEPFCRIEESNKLYIRISNAFINLDISEIE